MTYELRDMSGNLFKNDKGDNDKRPDYRGDLSINGVVYELAAWVKQGQKGKFMSIAAKPKDEAPATKPKPMSSVNIDDDTVPF